MAKRKNKQQKEIGKDNLDIYLEYESNGDRLTWIEEGDKNENYYFGKHFDKEATDILDSRGQLAVPINRIRPLIRHFVADVTQNDPVFSVEAVGNVNDTDKSWLFRGIIAKILRDNMIRRVNMRVINDMVRRGLGNMFIDFDPHARNGRGEIIIKYLDNREVVRDPNCKEWDFSDGENLIISKVISVTKAYELFPQYKKEINKCKGQHVADVLQRYEMSENGKVSKIKVGTDYGSEPVSSQEYVRIIQRQTKVKIPVYVVKDQWGRSREYYNEERLERYREKLANEKIRHDVIELNPIRVARHTSIMDNHVSSDILPFEDYSVIAFVDEDTQNPYPQGDITFLRPFNDVLNKAIGVHIYNAQIASNPRTYIDPEAIDTDDMADFRNKVAQPGAVITEVKDPKKNVTEIGGQLLSPSFLGIAANMEHQMDYQISISPQDKGDPTGAPKTYSATIAIHEWGKKNVAIPLKNINDAYTVAGKIVMSYIQSEYKFPEVIRINVDMIENLEEIIRDKDNLVTQKGKELLVKVNQAVEEAGQVKKYLNDLSVGEYDIAIVPDSFIYTDRTARLQQMMEMKAQNIVDAIAVLDESDIKNKEKIKDRMDLVESLRQTVEQATQKINIDSNKIKQLENALERADRLILEKEKETDMVREFERFKAELKITVAQLKINQNKPK